MIDTFASNNYSKYLDKLNDEELIDAYHRTQLAHKSAADDAKDQAYLQLTLTEHAMIGRFGLAEHMKRYLAKYPPP